MLPYAAWEEYAAQKRIVCAVGGDAAAESGPAQQLLGYVAIRLPRQSVAITHLVVREDMRKTGIARKLVEEVRRRYPDRRGISVRCRRDYPANQAWPKLGFVARGNRKGRSAEGHLLTDWWYDFGHHDLLTWQGGAQSSVPVVIDANVFLSLHARSPEERILQTISAVEDRLQILITPELFNELNRHSDGGERERLLRIAQGYPQLAVDPSVVNLHEEQILRGLARRPKSLQDRSDVRHVAYAMAAGINIVVSEDRKAKSRLSSAPALKLANVVITNPFNLAALLDEREGDPAYAPQALKETGYKLGEAGSDDADLGRFINNAAGERRTTYQAICDGLAAKRPSSHRLLLRDPQGSPVGLLGTVPLGGNLEVPLLRIRQCALQTSVATQLVGHLRELAAEESAEIIIVKDRHLDSAIYDALLEDGYHSFSGGLICLTIRSVMSLHQLRVRIGELRTRLTEVQRQAIVPLSNIANQDHSPLNTYMLEHQLRPLRLLDSDLDTWILPIKPAYAMDLFGYPPQLFDRRSDLGMRREHVFFRGQKSGEVAPGRVLWYASQPQCAVFAISTLVEVRDLTPEVAHRKYQRLGVFGLERLRAAAGPAGTVRALRIADTELLDHPVPLARLRRVAGRRSRTLQLWSATKIDKALFAELIGKALASD
ncbi:GNAT family N-acetyltransferase [Mycobacterium sp. 050128]|uniref:GNAT family N-acetyltransferase n=1 Tax=Mycobacterium sp. 050128 TaxID=3096112 RepID=UPI002EDB6E42